MRGESGAEKKAQKKRLRLVACSVCKKAGGKLVKHGGWYIHEECRSI